MYLTDTEETKQTVFMKDHMEYTANIAGQTLYGQIWEVEQAKAALIILHGMGGNILGAIAAPLWTR